MTTPAWKTERHNYQMKYKNTKEVRPASPRHEDRCDCGEEKVTKKGLCVYCGKRKN